MDRRVRLHVPVPKHFSRVQSRRWALEHLQSGGFRHKYARVRKPFSRAQLLSLLHVFVQKFFRAFSGAERWGVFRGIFADIPAFSREGSGGRGVASESGVPTHDQSKASGKPGTALYRDVVSTRSRCGRYSPTE